MSIINVSNLAGAYTSQARFDEAIEVITESFEINGTLKRQLNYVYLISGKVEEAQEIFEDAN